MFEQLAHLMLTSISDNPKPIIKKARLLSSNPKENQNTKQAPKDISITLQSKPVCYYSQKDPKRTMFIKTNEYGEQNGIFQFEWENYFRSSSKDSQSTVLQCLKMNKIISIK